MSDRSVIDIMIESWKAEAIEEMKLKHEMLVDMVAGTEPYYNAFEHPLVKRCGSYTGGHSDTWSWNKYDLRKLSEKELTELYKTCKDSWK